MSANKDWEFTSDHDILVACVGYNFGPNPEEKIDEIRISRGGYGHTVARRMQLSRDDIVMDIGSGCGFVARTIAPLVNKIHCVDISSNFLRYCRKELASFPNVDCHKMSYADYSPLRGRGINCAYSTAVWIHFNYYDLYHNLMGLRDVLPSGGRVYFDYADPEGISSGDGRIFGGHSQSYIDNRETIFNLVQYNGISAIAAVAEQTGFDLVERWQTHAECYSVLIKKR